MGIVEQDYAELLNFESSDRYDEREKAALLFVSMIIWNPEGADAAVWERLRSHFSDEEIIELGYISAYAFGGQRGIKTLAVGHGEYMNESSSGLAPDTAEAAAAVRGATG